jgi:superfamily II DNA or RNA helicase
MSKSANNSILFNPGVARVARAQFPNDVLTDDILAQMEGGKRRMADGRISFDDTPFNLALVKQTYPDIQIELPSKLIYPPLVKTTETEYPYTLVNKPAPFKTQIECLQKCKDFPAFLVAHDPGTGKTRIGIDKAGRHFARGEITGVLIITLKGIHRQWISQIPIYLGLSHGKQIAYQAFAWDGKKDPFTHAYRQGTMDWFAVTFGALGSNDGINAINNFTERHKHKLMIIVDESHCIKSFNSQRTEACYNLSFRACVRLALSGTPITKSIEDEWCQSLFLDERIFGYRYQSSFRAAYCEV